MSTLYGLAVSNWLIWVSMVVFIGAYFCVTEAINKKEDKK